MTKVSASKKEKANSARFYAVVIAILVVWWFNNFTLKTVETSMTTGKVSSSIRVTVLSDLHLGSPGIGRSSVLSGVKRSEPDIVLVLGDMYTCSSGAETVKNASGFVCSIAAEGYPTYFVPGDHDISEQYLADLRAGGVHVMDYKCETVSVNGSEIRIMGIDNAYFSPTFDLHNEFTLEEGTFDLLMAHIPKHDKYADFGADLTVCADTHGGLVQLPLIGEVFDPLTNTVLPELLSSEPVYDKGWFDCGGGKMFITSGLGGYPIPVRLFNRPEIVTIEIKPE